MSTLSNSEVGRSLEHIGPTSSVEGAMTRHCQSMVHVEAPPDAVFSYLDDHSRLSAHMSKRSWMMAGSRMALELDAAEGRAVGSKIRLSGRVLGLMLFVDEVVIQRDPPERKVWETTSEPRLLIIGRYRMGFEIQPIDSGSRLTVFIDYALPKAFPARWFGRIFGRLYAQWCTRRMVNEAALHFGTK
jgi:hypothetical protein